MTNNLSFIFYYISMKDKVRYIHHKAYIHMKCCLFDLYDIKLRIDFVDYIEMMKKHPMVHTPGIFQRISFFIHHLDFFIYEVDLEVLRKAFESMKNTYYQLIECNASEELLNDYSIILTCLQKSLIKYGHLD